MQHVAEDVVPGAAGVAEVVEVEGEAGDSYIIVFRTNIQYTNLSIFTRLSIFSTNFIKMYQQETVIELLRYILKCNICRNLQIVISIFYSYII